jgi:ankyrin repeat protein
MSSRLNELLCVVYTFLAVCWLSGYENLTSLTLSSYFGRDMVITFLLEKGADLEATDTKHGWTPLLWAARSGC